MATNAQHQAAWRARRQQELVALRNGAHELGDEDPNGRLDKVKELWPRLSKAERDEFLDKAYYQKALEDLAEGDDGSWENGPSWEERMAEFKALDLHQKRERSRVRKQLPEGWRRTSWIKLIARFNDAVAGSSCQEKYVVPDVALLFAILVNRRNHDDDAGKGWKELVEFGDQFVAALSSEK